MGRHKNRLMIDTKQNKTHMMIMMMRRRRMMMRMIIIIINSKCNKKEGEKES